MELAFAAAIERDRIEDKIRKERPGKKALADLAALVRDKIITQVEADSLMTANAIVREASMSMISRPRNWWRNRRRPCHSAAGRIGLRKSTSRPLGGQRRARPNLRRIPMPRPSLGNVSGAKPVFLEKNREHIPCLARSLIVLILLLVARFQPGPIAPNGVMAPAGMLGTILVVVLVLVLLIECNEVRHHGGAEDLSREARLQITSEPRGIVAASAEEGSSLRHPTPRCDAAALRTSGSNRMAFTNHGR